MRIDWIRRAREDLGAHSVCGHRSDHGARAAGSRGTGRNRSEHAVWSRPVGLHSKVLSAPGIDSEAHMTFPIHRPRRLRRTESMRGFIRETHLTTSVLVYLMSDCLSPGLSRVA